jgi:SAM-dependent methyltransferase
VSGTHGRFERPKQLLRSTIPLAIRKGLARVVGRQTWLRARYWWVQELLRDFAERDPNAYHRFLWAHHLAYAETYEVALRFGPEQLHPSRRLLFDELVDCLVKQRVGPGTISSVFEVGCSLGYNLRFLETDVFRGATVLEGCDIDAYAVNQGDAYLRAVGSRVRVSLCDMADLDRRLDRRMYDVTVCAGVLMYLRPVEAEQVVAAILRHTSKLAVFAGLADPERDNATLHESGRRPRDGTFIHNLDSMAIDSGGRVVRRRWDGSRDVGGNTVYFVFATPGPS